jgi:hypothetical protein
LIVSNKPALTEAFFKRWLNPRASKARRLDDSAFQVPNKNPRAQKVISV